MSAQRGAPPDGRGPSKERAAREARMPVVTQVALAVGFVVATVVVLAVGRGSPEHTVDPAAVGSVTPNPILASHDFTFIRGDTDAFDQARQNAIAAVLPVWDHNTDEKELVIDRVARAFRMMRRELRNTAEKKAELAARPRDEGSGGAERKPSPPVELTVQERMDTASSERVLEELIRQLQIGVPRPVLNELARDGFSLASEEALLALVAELMDKRLVADRRVLDAESTRGITLRTLAGDAVRSEQVLRDFRDVLDRTEVERFLQRRATVLLADFQRAELADAVVRLAENLASPNTAYNERETRRRQKDAVDLVVSATQRRSFRRGEVILDGGRIVTAEVLEITRQMDETAPEQTDGVQLAFGTTVVVVLLVFPLVAFARTNLRRFRRGPRDLAMMASVLVAHLALTRLVVFAAEALSDRSAALPLDALLVLVPFAAGAMLVRVVTNADTSLVYAVAFALLSGFLFRFDMTFVVYAAAGGIVGSAAVGNAQTRNDILRAGLLVGALMAGLSLGVESLRGVAEAIDILKVSAMAAVSGVGSAAVVYASLPLLEAAFRYTTSIRLQELSNLNHPALKELLLKAPGSYHHSIMVAQLVEAACEAVGANALLGRVGSLYHDIGKTRNPNYFAENQRDSNPHARLKPHMSALIIKAHVKDGVEMARQYRLPEEIIDFIREHHGTSLMSFFLHRARQESEGEVNEIDFRYPGPRPQSRETAICMLSDGIEAASRSLPDPTPAHLKGLVQKMINKAFIDGQLDECELTLKDLNIIAHAIYVPLTSFYHHRPEYPEVRRSQPGRTSGSSPGSATSARKAPTSEPAEPAPRSDATAAPAAHPETPASSPPPPVRGPDDRDPGSGNPPPVGDGSPMAAEESGVHLRRLDM